MKVKFYLREELVHDGKCILPENKASVTLYAAYFDETGERIADVDVCINYASRHPTYIREDADGIFPYITATYQPTMTGFFTDEDFAKVLPICAGKLRPILRRGGYTCTPSELRERVKDQISRVIAERAVD